MGRNRILIVTLVLGMFLPCWARAADRSVIVRFTQPPGPTERSLIRKSRGTIQRSHQLIPALTVTLPEAEIAKLRKDSKIAYIEENVIYSAVPEPPSGNELGNSWGVAWIKADVAHASGNRGAGIKVAVLDTGIDYTHAELAANYAGGYDFVFNDSDPFDDNYFGHGTHVAGIVAAAGNGVGVIGVAPEAELLAVKVLDGGGFGRVSWIIAGIEWAVQQGADVINLSIQGSHSQGLQDACDAAYNAGVLLVAAGGNSLAGGGPVKYPAAYDSVIAATATDPSDQPGYFAPVGTQLELAAPGVDVLSTVPGGGYDYLSGTSQASPHVAGVAALFLASNTRDMNRDGTVDHRDVRYLLQTTAGDLGEVGKDNVYGYGLVNAAAAAFSDSDDDDDSQEPCQGWVTQVLTTVLEQLFSGVVPGGSAPETPAWVQTVRTTVVTVLDAVWNWKVAGPRTVAGLFRGKP